MIKHEFVICAYKESKYLEDCIISLKKQKKKSNIKFAYFNNSSDSTFNIAFDKKNESEIQNIIYMKGEKKQSKGMNGE